MDAPINVPDARFGRRAIGRQHRCTRRCNGFPDDTLTGENRDPERALPTIRRNMGEMGFNASFYHNSGFVWDPDNRLRQRAYGLLNVSVDWTSPDENQLIRARRQQSQRQRRSACMPVRLRSGDLCSPRAPRALSVEWSKKL